MMISRVSNDSSVSMRRNALERKNCNAAHHLGLHNPLLQLMGQFAKSSHNARLAPLNVRSKMYVRLVGYLVEGVSIWTFVRQYHSTGGA